MADPLPPQIKVERAIACVLASHGPLSGWAVLTEQPLDAAIEVEDCPALVVRTLGLGFDPSFESNCPALNVATIDIEALVMDPEPGATVPAIAGAALTHCRNALLADYTLGGMLQDLLPIDLAPGDGQRRDAGAISIQFRAEYLTDREDAFIILGHAGRTF